MSSDVSQTVSSGEDSVMQIHATGGVIGQAMRPRPRPSLTKPASARPVGDGEDFCSLLSMVLAGVSGVAAAAAADNSALYQ